MAGVTVPTSKKKSELSDIGGVVGGIAGAYYGESPQAAYGGYAAGSQIGNAVSPGTETAIPQVGGGDQRAAMMRRQEALTPYTQPSENEQHLMAAENAANQMPPAQRDQYLPTIQAARQRAAQGVA